jgi:hypothetical protein
MRHFLVPRPVPGLAGRVAEPAAPAVLIASASVVEGRAPGARRTRPGAVAITSIADPAEIEHLPAVGAGADHQAERIHPSSRGLREGVDTREDVCELWGAGRAGSCPRDLARGPGGVEPPGPHPLGARVGTVLPRLSVPGKPSPLDSAPQPVRVQSSALSDDRQQCPAPRRAAPIRAAGARAQHIDHTPHAVPQLMDDFRDEAPAVPPRRRAADATGIRTEGLLAPRRGR